MHVCIRANLSTTLEIRIWVNEFFMILSCNQTSLSWDISRLHVVINCMIVEFECLNRFNFVSTDREVVLSRIQVNLLDLIIIKMCSMHTLNAYTQCTITLRTQSCACEYGRVWDHVIGCTFKSEECNDVMQNQSRKQTGNGTTTLRSRPPGQEAKSPNVLNWQDGQWWH